MRKKRLARPVHIILCLLAILLVLGLTRLFCGPAPALSAAAALQRAQRRYIRPPVEMAACWTDRNEQLFAVWDGGEIQTYTALWSRFYRKYVDWRPGETLVEPVVRVRVYDRCTPWRDSRSLGWGCPGMPVDGALPLFVKNGDPAVASGRFTVRGEVNIGAWNAPIDVPYSCTADAERSDPRFFAFWVKPEGDSDTVQRVLNRLMNLGVEISSITAEAEIVWYDDSGEELYRQVFDMMEMDTQGEGSEEHGA